jgi:hypothetical protein
MQGEALGLGTAGTGLAQTVDIKQSFLKDQHILLFSLDEKTHIYRIS